MKRIGCGKETHCTGAKELAAGGRSIAIVSISFGQGPGFMPFLHQVCHVQQYLDPRLPEVFSLNARRLFSLNEPPRLNHWALYYHRRHRRKWLLKLAGKKSSSWIHFNAILLATEKKWSGEIFRSGNCSIDCEWEILMGKNKPLSRSLLVCQSACLAGFRIFIGNFFPVVRVRRQHIVTKCLSSELKRPSLKKRGKGDGAATQSQLDGLLSRSQFDLNWFLIETNERHPSIPDGPLWRMTGEKRTARGGKRGVEWSVLATWSL